MAKVPAKKPWESTDSTAVEAVETPAEETAVTEEVTEETPAEEVVPETPAEETPATEEVPEGELLDMVVAVVPNTFILNLDHQKTVTYQPGTQRMERSHAVHWWSIANGVTIFEG